MWRLASLKSMDVTDSPVWRKVLILSSVSIMNFSVFRNLFRVLRSKTGPIVGLGNQEKSVEED